MSSGLSDAKPCPAPGWNAVGTQPLSVCSVAAIRAAEHLAFAHMPSFTLMHNAGTEAAAAILHWLDHCCKHPTPAFVVLAGPGNNGGDACIVAAALHQAKHKVYWVNLESRKTTTQAASKLDPSPSDRQRAQQMAISAGLHPYTLEEAQQQWPQWQGHKQHRDPAYPEENTPALCVVDGLLGIGAKQAPSGAVGQALEWLHQVLTPPQHNVAECIAPGPTARQALVVALDCPSGLHCDTGFAAGSNAHQRACPGPAPLAADLTLSFIACKTGLLWGAGKDLCGTVWVHGLGCEPWVAAQAHMHCPAATAWAGLLPHRQHAQHKGSFGSVAVLGGSTGMVGAAVLAGRTALMLGAGRVALSCSEQTKQQPTQQASFDPLYPELMFKPWDQNQSFASVWLLGPGMGQSPQAQETLHQALAAWPTHQLQWPHPQNPAWVLDADALNMLAEGPALQPNWNPDQVVITPHPLEAARLLACSVANIQNQRLEAAQNLAQRYQCTVVLKGTGTVVTNPQGQTWVHSTGGPALATAGSGDVLAGAIAAFLAQGCSAWQAANAAVGLHGMAVDALPGHYDAAKVLTASASAIAQRMQARLNAHHAGA